MIIVIAKKYTGKSMLKRGHGVQSQCDHEEADTRMCVHLRDVLEKVSVPPKYVLPYCDTEGGQGWIS